MQKTTRNPTTAPGILEVLEPNGLRRAQCVEAWATLARAGLRIPTKLKGVTNEHE